MVDRQVLLKDAPHERVTLRLRPKLGALQLTHQRSRRLKRALSAYVKVYVEHVEAAQNKRHKPTDRDRTALPAADSDVWSDTAQDAFFRALARHSRLRISLIAEEVGEKSELECYNYLERLRSEYRALLSRAAKSSRDYKWFGLLDYASLPAAAEISKYTLAAEESLAPRIGVEQPDEALPEVDDGDTEIELDDPRRLINRKALRKVAQTLFRHPASMTADAEAYMQKLVRHVTHELMRRSIGIAHGRHRATTRSFFQTRMAVDDAAAPATTSTDRTVGTQDVYAAAEVSGWPIDSMQYWQGAFNDIEAMGYRRRRRLALADDAADVGNEGDDWFTARTELPKYWRRQRQQSQVVREELGGQLTDDDGQGTQEPDDDESDGSLDSDADDAEQQHEAAIDALDMHTSAIQENALRGSLGLRTSVPVPDLPAASALRRARHYKLREHLGPRG